MFWRWWKVLSRLQRVWRRLHDARDGIFLGQIQNVCGYTLVTERGAISVYIKCHAFGTAISADGVPSARGLMLELFSSNVHGSRSYSSGRGTP